MLRYAVSSSETLRKAPFVRFGSVLIAAKLSRDFDEESLQRSHLLPALDGSDIVDAVSNSQKSLRRRLTYF